MNKIKQITKSALAGIVLLSLILLNFSFTTSKYIEVRGLYEVDLTTSASVIVKMPGECQQSLRTTQATRFYGVDSCEVGIHLPGYYDPNTGEDAPMTMRYPQKDVQVVVKYVEYVIPQPVRFVSQKSKHKDYKLRFMAVSAPQWASNGGVATSYTLDSRTPFSLQNAMRLGALSVEDWESNWSASNWCESELLNDSVFLLNYYNEEKSVFEERLDAIAPQVLFIGSMTLSLPSAVEFAKAAKQKLGDKVFVVLGGKHPMETTYLFHGEVKHHPGSVSLLMQQGASPHVFDLVVSGDGEEVVQMIGEVIGGAVLNGQPIKNFSDYKDAFEIVRGNFILSWIDHGDIQTLVKQKNPLDYDLLPSPVSLFGVNNSFPVFGREYTAHIYSDMGKGCVFNCFFCSERSGVNGPVVQTGSPAQRLYNQLRDAAMQGDSMSAFAEDSIILTGNPKHLNELAELLEANPLNIVFGGQFTIDYVLKTEVQNAIKRLAKVGLVYVYTGMETANEDIAATMSKNTDRKHGWIERNEEAVRFLTENNIKHGISVLWGLGETQADRTHQLDVVQGWQEKYNNPVCVSPNWATQHPLFNQSDFTYTKWGTAKDSEYLPYFVQLFGEASEEYKLDGVELPSLAELEDLKDRFEVLNIQNI